ncbi:ATP-dependent DNA ligase [Rathayibacter sp. YIM 133350]|uniref:DUF7882 family protein n=1 Tax=Rathayibacter sp. YIM 133350 TaxID=3131992 RepID=UPI00307E57B4
MGSLIYGTSGIEIEFDDRVLAHLQAVINAKLRRGEAFLFTWRDHPSVGDGRSAAWIDGGIPLFFRFSGSKQPLLNKNWLEEMVMSASSTNGLMLMDEPQGESDVRAADNSVKRKDHPAR